LCDEDEHYPDCVFEDLLNNPPTEAGESGRQNFPKTVLGHPITVDPALDPGEWRLEGKPIEASDN
jgi:hypothetical protein